MTDISTTLSQFTEEAHNVSEFLITEEQSLEGILRGWAISHSHVVREPNQRNPFRLISALEAEDWLSFRFFEDIVFGTTGPDEVRGKKLSKELISQMGPATFQVSDFTVSDWTFSDVMVVTTGQRAFLIAFLGED